MKTIIRAIFLSCLFPALALAQPSGGDTTVIRDGVTTSRRATVTSANALKTDSSASTQPVSGTVAATQSGTWTVQPGNTANTTAWKVDGSAVTQPVSGTVSSTQGTSPWVTSATQSGTWTVQPGNIANTTAWKVDGSAVTQPVSGTVAVTQSTSPWVESATQSGTWTVQPGNIPNTTPWLVTDTPAETGGYTTFHLVSAGSTNATNLKASAGQLYCWYIYNSNAAARKVAFHNTAGTPTAGASVAFSLVIPAGSGANNCAPAGIPFNVGMAITTVTGLADSDATAVAANDLIINLWYK